jgi:adenine/guanine phosphoribosyltransferase-like PRPP-binding protein
MSTEPAPSGGLTYSDRYPVSIGSQHVELPVIALRPDFAIALLMTIDMGVQFLRTAAGELAELLAAYQPECIVSMATLGIPVAHEVTAAMGLDDYLILQKTPKIHLADSLRTPVASITTEAAQELMLDRRRIGLVRGRRVAIVDDVISTGGSISAALRLLDEAGAEVVAIGALLTEGDGWKPALGERAALVLALGTIPVFLPAPGGWQAAG